MFASLWIYALASVVEAAAEPCFALAQLKLRYEIRAAAETSATVARGVAAMGTVMWCETNRVQLGVLPFAAGQMAYAAVLLWVYVVGAWGVARDEGCALTPRWLGDRGPQKGEGCVVESSPASPCLNVHDTFKNGTVADRPTPIRSPQNDFILSLFSRQISSLAFNIYLQSGLKYLLTQGDALIITTMASLPDQGAYALASNYGSLAARLVFQPIEESSRTLFARLCSSDTQETDDENDRDTKSTPDSTKQHRPNPRNIPQAARILTRILHAYLLLALLAPTLGPPIAPKLLELVAGARWTRQTKDTDQKTAPSHPSSDAPSVLAAYTLYIPLLALNGITESFISAVATPGDLRAQSRAMGACSVAFAGAAWGFLRWPGGWGARGLVWANCVGMVGRVVWGAVWIWGWFGRVGGEGNDEVGSGKGTSRGKEKNSKDRRMNPLSHHSILPHPLTPLITALGAYTIRSPPAALLRLGAWLAHADVPLLAVFGGNRKVLASLGVDAVTAVVVVVGFGVFEWRSVWG